MQRSAHCVADTCLADGFARIRTNGKSAGMPESVLDAIQFGPNWPMPCSSKTKERQTDPAER